MDERSRRLLTILVLVSAILTVGYLASHFGGAGKEVIRVVAADGLAASFERMRAEFERLHPKVDVRLEVHGSLMLVRLVPLWNCDVVAVADARLIERVLAPNEATWAAQFGTTEIVLAGNDSSRYGSEINTDNWYDVLLRKGVRYGYSDPSQDPCGYFTRLCWKLAQKHYSTPGHERRLYDELVAGCPASHLRPDVLTLLSVLESRAALDYAFVYKCHAVDRHLPYTPLPKQINLGEPQHEAAYAAVEVTVPNYRGGVESITGSYITFGITIPSRAGHQVVAEEFVKFVLSERGRSILLESAIQPISPAAVPKWCEVPAFLRGLAVPQAPASGGP
jgi:molybdate/tungstate transport system substrate-binding protein